MSNEKLFTVIDESFTCSVCGHQVAKLGYTARDHCPSCLHSKHVDINPGDRQEKCHGILVPIAIDNDKKGQYKIVYRCEKCGQSKRNIVAQDDNMDLIIKIMAETKI